MRIQATAAILATMTLAACGGGGGGSTPIVPNPGNTNPPITQSADENAVSTANAFGSPVKALTNFNNGTSGATSAGLGAAKSHGNAETLAIGQCNNGVEFWAPDKANDANSTEEQFFYDASCTQLARDAVRIYSINGNTETANKTMKLYAINNAAPIAVRTDAVAVSNATFDSYGYPVVSAGFDRSQTGELDLSGSKTIAADDELVMLPGSNGVNNYCGDHASYNATGFAALNETFGSAGGVASGTRTVNSDGSVTWQATHAGTSYKGAIGSLSIALGAANSACPIATPEYSLSGGTAVGQYSIPMSVTFKNSVLQNLTITNAQLANGNSLSVTTNAGVSPTSNTFITGTISNASTQVATFAVDAFGDGTLTVSSSGKQYVMTDWHVIK